MTYNNLEEFAFDFSQQIVAEANIPDEEKFIEDVFVDRMLDYLHEAEELENAIPCPYKGYGMKVDAYDLNTQQNGVDILISHYEGYTPPPVQKIGKNDMNRAFKRASNFLIKSMTGYHGRLEESSDVYDLAKLLNQLNNEIRQARIILLTDCLTGSVPGQSEKINGLELTYQIWDIERLYRFVSSGMKKDPVVVNFEEDFGRSLECVSINDAEGLYTTYLSIIPGEILSSLYDKWGTRILERNVRAFLQARGKVNRGIRDTIIHNPNMFLAYNNGITVTAESVKVSALEKGGYLLKEIKDFQIVNGGQTIASLWHTNRKNKASLSKVSIQMKLTILNNLEVLEEIVPLISKYSNTQNKVNTADFHANDPFHINLEKISRTTWAPDPSGGGQQTIWFYEGLEVLMMRQETGKELLLK